MHIAQSPPARLQAISVIVQNEAEDQTRSLGFLISKHQFTRARHGDVFTGVRQRGLILGLEYAKPEGAVAVSRALYENGVWAIFSSLDKRVLQWKPGVLLSPEMCAEILERYDAAMPRARELMFANEKAK